MTKSKAFPGMNLYTVSQTTPPFGAAIFLNSLTKRGEMKCDIL